MTTIDELLDDLLKDVKRPGDLMGKSGILKHIARRLFEKAILAELTQDVFSSNKIMKMLYPALKKIAGI